MKKCKFSKECPNYDEASDVCNKLRGMYYGDGTRPAGCYRKMEEENK